MWQRAMKLDYTPIVHVARIKPKAESTILVEVEQELRDSDEVASGALDVMPYWHVGLNNYVIKYHLQIA